MRQKKAKNLRRMVYGDLARRGHGYVRKDCGYMATGRRRIYQAAKKAIKENPELSAEAVVEALTVEAVKQKMIRR